VASGTGSPAQRSRGPKTPETRSRVLSRSCASTRRASTKPGESDGLHWPRRDGLNGPTWRRLLLVLMLPDLPGEGRRDYRRGAEPGGARCSGDSRVRAFRAGVMPVCRLGVRVCGGSASSRCRCR